MTLAVPLSLAAHGKTHVSYEIQVQGKHDHLPAKIHAIEDNFTDGWVHADTIVMLHGIAENAAIWVPWSPHLARTHRVLRLDLRGYGTSSAMPHGFTLADWADDVEQLINSLQRKRVHLVGTKLGALVAFEVAQRRPSWLASMTLAGMLPSPSTSLGPWLPEWLEMVESGDHGVRRWAEATMPGRMGSSLSPAAMHWWVNLMGEAPAASVAQCLRLLPGIDGPTNPDRVTCPTLFIAAGAPQSHEASYNQRPSPASLQHLRSRVPRAQWVEVLADSYHIAATHPDACAKETLAFINRIGVR